LSTELTPLGSGREPGDSGRFEAADLAQEDEVSAALQEGLRAGPLELVSPGVLRVFQRLPDDARDQTLLGLELV